MERTLRTFKKEDPSYPSIDAAAFSSKNLYNQANYQIRQTYIDEGGTWI